MARQENKKSFSRPKANLFMGQRFLVSRAVLQKIIAAAGLSPNDTVLEVGAGTGMLTEALAGKVKKVIAVEKDLRLAARLRETFRDAKNIHIIEGDILTMGQDAPSSLRAQLAGEYKIVANLPYYLTSRFLRIFLSPKHFHAPASMTLLVQKEVAERIVEDPPKTGKKEKNKKKGKMSLLGLSVRAYGTPALVATVKPSAFHKPPKVDSAVITITDISPAFFTKERVDKEEFFRIAKKAFGGKRKQLRNSLKQEFTSAPEHHKKELLCYEAKRPEELALEDWKTLYQLLQYP